MTLTTVAGGPVPGISYDPDYFDPAVLDQLVAPPAPAPEVPDFLAGAAFSAEGARDAVRRMMMDPTFLPEAFETLAREEGLDRAAFMAELEAELDAWPTTWARRT